MMQHKWQLFLRINRKRNNIDLILTKLLYYKSKPATMMVMDNLIIKGRNNNNEKVYYSNQR